jgi:DNA polymerase-3 subunit epsilon
MFYCIDVETANSDISSICQIGIAGFEGGELKYQECIMLNPQDEFDNVNINIHGITPEMVENAPTFATIYPQISKILNKNILISHTHFDRASLNKAIFKNRLSELDVKWLDSAKVVRRAWPKFATSGYGLANVCHELNISFKHHDALEDAIACGKVMLSVFKESGLGIEDWIKRANISNTSLRLSQAKANEINIDGALYGETVAFTGSLVIPRADATLVASELGCNVSSGVTKKITLLVVGDQDVTKLAGKSKSIKHLKAEKLIEQGLQIRILKESDFIKLISDNT